MGCKEGFPSTQESKYWNLWWSYIPKLAYPKKTWSKLEPCLPFIQQFKAAVLNPFTLESRWVEPQMCQTLRPGSALSLPCVPGLGPEGLAPSPPAGIKLQELGTAPCYPSIMELGPGSQCHHHALHTMIGYPIQRTGLGLPMGLEIC